jgi:uncharacterized membrane protein YvlD (DUF360 family)
LIRLFIVRYAGCAAALALGCLLFTNDLSAGVLGWAALLAGLYAVLKPLYSLIVLPLDMFLFGVGTLCLDALMIRAAMPYGFAYWQALAVAAAVALLFIPYEKWRPGIKHT